MRVFNDVMTVQELIDLVAFLQPKYKIKPITFTIMANIECCNTGVCAVASSLERRSLYPKFNRLGRVKMKIPKRILLVTSGRHA
ncbi:MAG: hypothetical protein ACI9LX_003791 [Paraglaciecola sp.]|jgi:hypothetical protein